MVSTHAGTAESKGYLCEERRFNKSIIYTITIPTVEDARTPSLAEAAPEPPPWIRDTDDEVGGSPAES
ncbi:hypothetical protein [Arthrobacter sp. I3]|uniref:hypothetical protein n=1 Tax=Arthrobacter sp. I3 TaxID=218158 RepID=UPI0004858474|nr:hypothetical protein [Arthrobacter sp. I3]